MSEKMLWNNSSTASVKASAIREFKILNSIEGADEGARVLGIFHDGEVFDFGPFLNMKDARDFIDVLHMKIERGNDASD